MTDRYAVIGNPIAHSKSPQIHAQFAAQTGQDLQYEKLLAPLDGFAATADQFRAAGGKGANVTVPFKLDAARYATRLTPAAQQAGAVNTLIFHAAEVVGDNTDGIGLVRDLTHNLQQLLRGRRILLLGAGGAARGVLQPLLDEKPAALVLANRTLAKALELAALFQQKTPTQMRPCGFAELAGQSFDVVVNATASSLQDEAPPLPAGVYAPGALAYDLMYAPQPTAFMRAAQAAGAARVCDGLGMLVEQAAQSFYLWRGVRPDTAPVLVALRAA
ncbi:MAG: shikimate dehydrogenase [Burkholderiaceae bacterium]|nr:MAG: shikimate dehydrogenase [Burkholderiaceae bacterium]